MKKGILIVAVNNPMYGRTALNLAVSIKAVDKEWPVALIADDVAISHLNDAQRDVFDKIIHAPGATELKAGAKLLAYKHTPFDHTMVIDADNLWLSAHAPAHVFQSLEGTPFTAITEGFIHGKDVKLNAAYPIWAHYDDIKKAYKLDGKRMYQWRTEIMYFEKSKVAEQLFSKALEIFKKPKVAHTVWDGGVPDELAVNIAAAITGVEPHEFNWQPTYWAQKHGGRVLPIHMIQKDYFVFSTGGNQATPAIQKTYNIIAAASHRRIGLQFLFTLQSKSRSIATRSKF